jgi:hypothetical protein
MIVPGGCGIMRFGTSLLWLPLKWEKRRSWMSSPQWRFADFRLDPLAQRAHAPALAVVAHYALGVVRSMSHVSSMKLIRAPVGQTR